jgi:hypothetical protein
MNKACFQWVGELCGPVLKLVIFSFLLDKLWRLWGAGFPPTGHSSANTASPSFITLTSVSGGTGLPEVVKNVSKYRMRELILVRLAAFETKVKGDEKSS